MSIVGDKENFIGVDFVVLFIGNIVKVVGIGVCVCNNGVILLIICGMFMIGGIDYMIVDCSGVMVGWGLMIMVYFVDFSMFVLWINLFVYVNVFFGIEV